MKIQSEQEGSLDFWNFHTESLQLGLKFRLGLFWMAKSLQIPVPRNLIGLDGGIWIAILWERNTGTWGLELESTFLMWFPSSTPLDKVMWERAHAATGCYHWELIFASLSDWLFAPAAEAASLSLLCWSGGNLRGLFNNVMALANRLIDSHPSQRI